MDHHRGGLTLVDWDKRYREADAPLFGDGPNEYVRAVLARSGVEISSALCIGDGDGRNGRWLAQQGIRVTAVDISGVATEKALAADQRAGVGVERVTADIAAWTPPDGAQWDAVFMIYLQCDAATRNGAAARMSRYLAPGGWFAAEGFAPNNSGGGDLGPKANELLYERDDLIAALPGFSVVEALKGWTQLTEGGRHRGRAWILRLLARRDTTAG